MKVTIVLLVACVIRQRTGNPRRWRPRSRASYPGTCRRAECAAPMRVPAAP